MYQLRPHNLMRFCFGGIITVVDDAGVRLKSTPMTVLGFAARCPKAYARLTPTLPASRSASAAMPLPPEHAPFAARCEIRRPACRGMSV